MNAHPGGVEETPLRPGDWALLLTMTGFWLLCLVLHLSMVFGPGEYLPAFVPSFEDSADGTPVIASPVSDQRHGGDELLIGDRIVELDGESLADVGPLRFQYLLAEAFHHRGAAELLLERDGTRVTARITPSKRPLPYAHLPPVLGYAIIALVVLLRAPGMRGARLFFASFMALAIFQSPIGSGPGELVVAGRLLFILMGSVSLHLVMRWLITFPRPPASEDPRPRVPTWVAWVVPVLFPVPRLAYYFGGLLSPDAYILQTYSVDMLFSLLVIGVLGWNYHCVDRANRRKIRWVLLGVYAGFVPIALVQLAAVLFTVGTWFFWLQSVAILFYVCVPLSLFMAMRHFNLFDVDRIITGSVWYTALIVLFALFGEAIFEPFAGTLATAFGADADIAQLMLVGLLAAVAIPVQNRLRPHLERLFFPARGNLQEDIEALVEEIAAAEEEDFEVTARLIASRVAESMAIERCTVYVERDGAFVPSGDADEAPIIEGPRATEVRALFERRLLPLRLRQGGRQEVAQARLFRSLDADLVVPFEAAGGARGFLSLGRKRSGDVFTNTDVSLLAGIAVQLSLREA